MEGTSLAHRTFLDSAGVRWIAWDVTAERLTQHAERRARDRRHRQLPIAGSDRRTGERRGAVSPEMTHGWLAFRSALELRRVLPIPAGWEQMTDTELERLCRTGVVSTERVPPPG